MEEPFHKLPQERGRQRHVVQSTALGSGRHGAKAQPSDSQAQALCRWLTASSFLDSCHGPHTSTHHPLMLGSAWDVLSAGNLAEMMRTGDKTVPLSGLAHTCPLPSQPLLHEENAYTVCCMIRDAQYRTILSGPD